MALGALSKVSTATTQTFIGILISRGLIPESAKSALTGKDLEAVDTYLASHFSIPAIELAQAYADFYRLPFVRLVNRPIQPAVVKLLPEDVARRYFVAPIELKGLELTLAIGEPSKLQENAPLLLVRLRQQKGLQVNLVIVSKGDVMALLEKIYSRTHPTIPSVNSTHPTTPQHPTASANHLGISLNKPVIAKPIKPVGKEVVPKPDMVAKHVDLKGLKIPAELLKKIPLSVAKKYEIIIFAEDKPKSRFEPSLVKVAAVNLEDPHVKEILAYIEEKNKILLDRYITDRSSFQIALHNYPAPANQAEDEVEITSEVTESPAVTKPPHTPLAGSAHPPVKGPIVPEMPNLPNKTSRPTAQLPSGNGLSLSSEDIVNQQAATDQTPEELERIAQAQLVSVEDRNLDKLLKKPILKTEDLAEVYRTGLIPEIVAATLFLAIRMKASDVHIEAEREVVRVRFRIDGILHDVIRVPVFLHAPLISRIKILSKMKIDEQRVPQDGRFDVIVDNRQVDLRVSTLPTVHGEKIVMRLLDKSAGIMSLEELGVTGSNFDTLIANISKPYGIILSTGPTGSGKSTTLYAILTRISKPDVNIITLEDPVEYELVGLNQAQVKPQIGFTFAEGLRSVLRQDPNIIMVGEIRDLETAAMATHAALTGHLVLSTLHTNDAAGALPRLINMGVEPFLITSSLNAVMGQRLVRKICDDCREAVSIPSTVLTSVKHQLAAMPHSQLKNIDMEQLVFYHGRGCPNCTNGYQGRIGIYEVLAMSHEIEELAVRKAPASEIKQAAIKAGMITMTQDGLIKALKGITTVDEVLRVTTTEAKEVPGS